MKLYLRLLKYLLPHKLTVLFSIACMFVFAGTSGAMAYLVGPVMKFLFIKDGSESIKIIPYDIVTIPPDKMMAAVPIIIVVVALVNGVSSYGHTYLMGYVGQRVVTSIRDSLYRHILDMPTGYFLDNPTGVLTARITNDVNMLQTLATETLARVLKQSLTIVVLAVVVVRMDWKMAVAALAAFPMLVYPMARFGKRVKDASKKGQVTVGAMTSILNEAITGIRIVKAFCMEKYEADRFDAENERLSKYHMRNIKIRAIASPMMEVFGAFAFAGTILYAAYRISSGTLAPEDFISFFAAVMMLYQPVKALNGVNLNLQNGLAAAQRVFDVMDTPSEARLLAGSGTITGLKETIEYRDVSFSYGRKDVLKNINLTVKKGEVTALVGLSGAGKTTFVNLLPRFFDATGGAILVDGRDIREIKPGSLREMIALVSQHVVLFNDTIRNNIAYGDRTIDEARIVAAAEAANAHGFISRLHDGYDTVIGEGGVKLSGGERQRISIARAILKNAPVLIMDEATSSLDTESEMEVQKGLENLMKGRTSFVIAHRLSTVRRADRIVVLNDGMIVEVGRHDELLARGKEYSKLYNMQIYGRSEAALA